MMNIPYEKVHGSNSKSVDESKPPPATFSIATPAVTTILFMAGDYNENSYMQSSNNYHQEVSAETVTDDHTQISGQSCKSSDDADKMNTPITDEPQSDNSTGPKESVKPDGGSNAHQPTAQDPDPKSIKKKDKISKKSAKLDVKSKLEKSRQSARECRARKKLRYQYLEDLVCNREKAVVKLREELSMVGYQWSNQSNRTISKSYLDKFLTCPFQFCELSKRVESGVVSEADKKLITE